jgi:hypothetical protein
MSPGVGFIELSGIVVIGGMLTSTLRTLLVLPASELQQPPRPFLMTDPISPFEVTPPSSRRLYASIAAAVAAAAVLLVLFVLPAEYGIDPTGLGKRMGLTAMNEPSRTLQIQDVIGGNEEYREVKIPDPGDPTPLPNPAVVQLKSADAQTKTVTVTLGLDEQTEIKALLDTAQVILYSWRADGEVYTDFHGHEPDAGSEFVRYEEQQTGREGRGSLVAPFTGEHGWFWLNISEKPVTITLTITGYQREIIDYGIFQ